MSITSVRTTTLTYTGDLTGTFNVGAQANPFAVRPEDTISLLTGANTITIPTGGNTVPTAVTIVPPEGNTVSITLKGVSGDTGIVLNKIDSNTISLDPSVTSFVLTAVNPVTVRIYWS